jgi:hypothetical protein
LIIWSWLAVVGLAVQAQALKQVVAVALADLELVQDYQYLLERLIRSLLAQEAQGLLRERPILGIQGQALRSQR